MTKKYRDIYNVCKFNALINYYELTKLPSTNYIYGYNEMVCMLPNTLK